ncbi:hypothetical protein PHLGIDRAFT_212912 [Phlebiopsis gigantea 11061_1 CR5-6]|uniref:Uncharacterized protein n=1 Tax=Phlebiopsis gigantea (strain 11061_1 CR5-6) TaxID=745531 RepID=A0A0C3S6C8_PHLG1|nr:hypothetical protein PHLGIDRAFT_212912 [Phlebiopsis gigantea 11061_1 CR5-6]
MTAVCVRTTRQAAVLWLLRRTCVFPPADSADPCSNPQSRGVLYLICCGGRERGGRPSSWPKQKSRRGASPRKHSQPSGCDRATMDGRFTPILDIAPLFQMLHCSSLETGSAKHCGNRHTFRRYNSKSAFYNCSLLYMMLQDIVLRPFNASSPPATEYACSARSPPQGASCHKQRREVLPSVRTAAARQKNRSEWSGAGDACARAYSGSSVGHGGLQDPSVVVDGNDY